MYRYWKDHEVVHVGEELDYARNGFAQRINHRFAFAEFIGSFLYTMVVCGSILSSGTLTYQLNFMEATIGRIACVALASASCYGALQYTMISFTDQPTRDPDQRKRFMVGHINPLLTVAAALSGEIAAEQAVLYTISQLFGASLASIFLVACIPDARSTQLGTTVPATGTTEWHAALFELIGSYIFVIVTLVVTIGRSENEEEADVPADGGAPRAESLFVKESAPAICAATLFVLTAVGAAISGCAINPARAWGPALVSSTFTSHWLYWVSPIFGTLLASVTFQLMMEKANNTNWLRTRVGGPKVPVARGGAAGTQ